MALETTVLPGLVATSERSVKFMICVNMVQNTSTEANNGSIDYSASSKSG